MWATDFQNAARAGDLFCDIRQRARIYLEFNAGHIVSVESGEFAFYAMFEQQPQRVIDRVGFEVFHIRCLFVDCISGFGIRVCLGATGVKFAMRVRARR
jgi:hypothetical protein